MSHTSIHLGYEVGTGTPVSIPLRHMVVTGQTQEAGKTTALEALIARSGVKAIVFVTKRGEGSFVDARIIPPYFREKADWQFVASILEASRGEKLKFERAWIIRASKGARTLADVHHNVRKAMETAKGLSADVYLTLDAYLEAVVPQIDRVRWAARVDLAAGVNAMDLTGLNVEMQHLVIRSTIEWVQEQEKDTVVVVPEAWKFIPQGRGTPVKLAAEAFIRQAAALRNYLWLDSQDIAGVEKIILKSVPVWILGVQRESNEVKRTLDQIPAGIKKPKLDQVATLPLGHFFACHGSHITEVYVQPAWLSERDAIAVARGVLERPPTQPNRPPRGPVQETTVTEAEARELRAENAELRRRLAELEGHAESSNRKAPADVPVSGHRDHGDAGRTPASAAARPAREWTAGESMDNEALYQAIKARLMTEAPALIRILASKPEIEVSLTRKTLQMDEFSLKGRIARLLKDGFFSSPRGCGAVRTALKRTGPDANTANIGRALDDFTRDGFVTDEGSGYQEVPGMKVNVVEQ
jgi:hypothetical protein